MIALPCGEEMTICWAVSIQCRNVTDRQNNSSTAAVLTRDKNFAYRTVRDSLTCILLCWNNRTWLVSRTYAMALWIEAYWSARFVGLTWRPTGRRGDRWRTSNRRSSREPTRRASSSYSDTMVDALLSSCRIRSASTWPRCRRRATWSPSAGS